MRLIYVKKLILDKDCEITVYKQGKYGRYVARVMYPVMVKMEGFSITDGGKGDRGEKMTLQYKDLAKDLLVHELAVKVDY